MNNSVKIQVDADLVQRLIETQFPQWTDLPIKLVEPGGWDNRTFHLGEHMSVRLPSAKEYAEKVEEEYNVLYNYDFSLTVARALR